MMDPTLNHQFRAFKAGVKAEAIARFKEVNA